ncbi:MAG TPA: hypothetical protein VLH61_03670 [Bacteroidales bacterium]|nr:hypothetical protein [Bacteroidales bacterium]
MNAEIKKLYDYQWELTMVGAQFDERIVRSNFKAGFDGNLKGLSRSLILTASNIKYELIDLENRLKKAENETGIDEQFTFQVTETLRTIELMLFQTFKGFVQLIASLEKEQGMEEASALLKEFWPKLAEIYQFFKNYHTELKGIS